MLMNNNLNCGILFFKSNTAIHLFLKFRKYDNLTSLRWCIVNKNVKNCQDRVLKIKSYKILHGNE